VIIGLFASLKKTKTCLNYILDEEKLAHRFFSLPSFAGSRSGHFMCPSDTIECFHGSQSQLGLITSRLPPELLFSSCD
jgi:hypothetical protein